MTRQHALVHEMMAHRQGLIDQLLVPTRRRRRDELVAGQQLSAGIQQDVVASDLMVVHQGRIVADRMTQSVD